MNNLSQWFHDQLKASGDGFAWAVEQMPAERWYLAPPRHPEDWSAARHLLHMLYYEKYVVLPVMKYWPGESLPDLPAFYQSEEEMWGNGQDHKVESLLVQFREVRSEEIALLPDINDVLWNKVRETVWGLVPLHWIVTKTYQHTCEHTHDVLRMVLWWDR